MNNSRQRTGMTPVRAISFRPVGMAIVLPANDQKRWRWINVCKLTENQVFRMACNLLRVACKPLRYLELVTTEDQGNQGHADITHSGI